jgi:hypothetical protein
MRIDQEIEIDDQHAGGQLSAFLQSLRKAGGRTVQIKWVSPEGPGESRPFPLRSPCYHQVLPFIGMS